MDSDQRAAILVLGMHRSGTSAVAGALSLLGAVPPAHLIPAGDDNPSGFWESLSIVGTNDWILNQGDATWYECLGFDVNALNARTRAMALTFVMLCMMSEFRDTPRPLIKDPRICLLLDLWLPALRARGATPVAVVVMRSPEEVAESLAERDHLPVAITAGLWLRYMLDAEHGTRGCPRHIVLYDDLLRDWREVLTLVGQRVAIRWPVGVETVAPRMGRFLDARLRHFGPDGPHKIADPLPFADWLEETCAALRGLARDGTDARQLQRLDRVRAAFQTWRLSHGRIWADTLLHRHGIRSTHRFDVPPAWHRIASDIPDAITLPTE